MKVLQRVKNYWTEHSNTFGASMFSESERDYDANWHHHYFDDTLMQKVKEQGAALYRNF